MERSLTRKEITYPVLFFDISVSSMSVTTTVLAATSAEADALATIGAHRQTAGRAGATRKRCGDGAKAPTVASTGNSRRTRRCIESVAGESLAK